MTTQAPLNWVRQIQETLADAKVIPLHGSPPPFDWEKCAREIARSWGIPSLTLSAHNTQWLKASELAAGFGMNGITIALELTPLVGKAYFIFAREEIARLTALLLTKTHEGKGFTSFTFQEGFYYFLAQKALHALNALQPLGSLAVKMAPSQSLTREDALAIDLSFTIETHTFWGRLICPNSLHQAFKAHFSTRPALSLDTPLAKQLELSLRLIAGKTTLSTAAFQQLKTGDFLILDHCSFDPKTHKGALTLTLEETPLLRARVKEEGLKITDYALYHEEEKSMSDDTRHDEDDNEDEEFFDDEEEEEEDDDDDGDEDEEEDEEEDEDDDDEEELDEEEEEASLATEGEHLWAKEEAERKPTKKILSSREIPLTLSVEVDRLKMTLDQLLQLQPGNVLELSTRPEQGVDLTIGGKRVARAELVKLGDLLGVKILEVGH